MLKIQLSGNSREIKPFLYDLSTRNQYQILDQCTCKTEQNEICWTAKVENHPERRVSLVYLHGVDGTQFCLPILDLIQCEIHPGVHMVAGSVFDPYTSTRKLEGE